MIERMTLAEFRSSGLDKRVNPTRKGVRTGRGAAQARPSGHVSNSSPTDAVLVAIARQSPPQALLTEKAMKAFPDVVIEYTPLAGSAVRVDLAFPALQLAVEVNGWSNHGKTLKAFQNDHVRTRKLMLAGWVILPFTAGEVLEDCAGCVRQIAEMKRLIQSVW